MSESLNAELKIEYVPIADVKPYEGNPRVNDAAIPALKESIKDFRFSQPITVDADGVVITGHTRLAAAKALGMETVPVMRRTDLTPEQVKALRLADNKVAELSEWDFDKLKVELADIPSLDMASLGFDLGELGLADADVGTGGQTDADDVPEVDEGEEAASKRGEVYLCGRHRLVCGDSTKAEDVGRVCREGEADMWLTDPPYNVAYEGSNGLTIQNDSMEDVKFREFLRTAFGHAEKALKPGAPFYIFHADLEGYNFRGACHDVGLRVRQCLVWKKNALVLGRQDYQWIHEPCLYGWKDGGPHPWYADRSQTTVMEFNKPKKNDVHPTMKPVEMLVYLLQNSSKRGDVVLDTFGGSGSTLIACEQTGRVCKTVELDPHYCDVIRRRWAEFVHGEGCDWQKLTPAEKAL